MLQCRIFLLSEPTAPPPARAPLRQVAVFRMLTGWVQEDLVDGLSGEVL